MKARICLTGLLFFLCTCDGLFGSFTRTNPENCVENPGICASNLVCDTVLELCVDPGGTAHPGQLTLNAVLPPQGPVGGGNQVTMDGQGFETGIVVSFDGVSSNAVNVQSSTRLTATVPASRTGQPGMVPVEVSYIGGARARWNGLYMYGAALIGGPINFMPVNSVGTSIGTSSLLVADFDTDGKSDVATMLNSNVIMLFGDGAAGFPNNRSHPQGATTTSGIIGDFNSDTAKDIVTIDTAGKRLISMLNNGTGQTFAATPYADSTANNLGNAAAGDFDGDGDQDVAVIDKATDSIRVFLNQGSGTFSTPTGPQIINVGATAVNLVAAQYTSGDANLDIVIAHNTTGTGPNIGLLRGLGNGGFMAETLIGKSSNLNAPQPSSIVVQDFDQDGKKDVMVLNVAESSVGFLYGDGGTGVRNYRDFQCAFNPPTTAIAVDLNNDGILDIVSGSTSANIYSMRGLGNGDYEQPVKSTPTNLGRVQTLAAADFNSDSKPDLVVLDDSGGKIQVLLNVSM